MGRTRWNKVIDDVLNEVIVENFPNLRTWTSKHKRSHMTSEDSFYDTLYSICSKIQGKETILKSVREKH